MTLGFLVVDKPRGISSNEVVSRVRRATGVRKAGHAGTLDPMATGVVVVAVGSVTRLIRFIQDQPKEYLATAQFGVSTDSLDADGSVLERTPMSVSVDELKAVAERFLGTVMQVPPMVSALKHEGRRLYELARQGETVERQARPVQIFELEILGAGPGPYPDVEFRVVCGKGTYVRSLADDMAAALGGRAHLTQLRRTRIGAFGVEKHALHADDLTNWESALIDPSAALSFLPEVAVSEETARGVRNGMRFIGGEIPTCIDVGEVRVLDENSALIAVYEVDGEAARPVVVLAS